MSDGLENLSKEELWEYCVKEYDSNNIIVKKMINNFFNKINKFIDELNVEDKILEVGCGAGESSERIYSMLVGQHFEISEYDKRYVDILKSKKLPYGIIEENVYQMNRADNSFDVIFLLEVMEHLENVEIALQELFRVSKKYVVISVPNEPLWRVLNFMRLKYVKDLGNTPGHINHWSKRKLFKLLSKYGTVKRIMTPYPWLIAVVEKNG